MNKNLTKPEEAREAFLADVSQQLQNWLSPLEVYESVQEMRTHIDSLAAAYHELGMRPLEAMDMALRKFGVPQEITSNLSLTTPIPSTITIPVSAVLSLSFSTILGILLFELSEAWFAITAHYSTIGLRMDLEIGGCAGLFVGLLALKFSKRPNLLGILVSGSLNIFLATNLYPTYMGLGQFAILRDTVILMTLGSYVLTAASASLSQRLTSGRRPTKSMDLAR